MSHIKTATQIVNFNPNQFHPNIPVYVGFASYDQARHVCYRLKLLRNGGGSQVNIEVPYTGWEQHAATESYAKYILSLVAVGDFEGFGSFHTQESHAQEQEDFAPREFHEREEVLGFKNHDTAQACLCVSNTSWIYTLITKAESKADLLVEFFLELALKEDPSIEYELIDQAEFEEHLHDMWDSVNDPNYV